MEQQEQDQLNYLALRIQLAATAVASSFVLLFVPNVETITLTAFLLGFLFPLQFAVVTTLTMVITWEVLISMVLGFSGFTFPFKIVAWLLIVLLGRFSRSIRSRYFYEFMVFGALSAFIFDLLVTVPTAFLFINDQNAFLPVLYSSLILGIVFTISHTISNAIFFGFLPVIIRSILPLLQNNYEDLVKIPTNYFDYLKDLPKSGSSRYILRQNRWRAIMYVLVGLLLVSILVAGVLWGNQPQTPHGAGTIEITYVIDYSDVLTKEVHRLNISTDQTAFMILLQIATVNYTQQLGGQPYVKAINGVWENENLTNHYWLIFLNHQFANTGANITYFKQGDLLEWRYQ